MEFKFLNYSSDIEEGLTVLFIDKSLKFSYDQLPHGNTIEKEIKLRKDFEGKENQRITFSVNGKLIMICGVGDSAKINLYKSQEIGAFIASSLNTMKIERANLLINQSYALDIADYVSHVCFGIAVKNYAFNQYYKKKLEEHKTYLNCITVYAEDFESIAQKWQHTEILANNVLMARDLINSPANDLNPVTFAQKCVDLMQNGLGVKVLEQEELRALGMGALLGVAQGSNMPPKVVIMEWKGDEDSEDVSLAFVGKGVTFDSGGISIKPSAHMAEMKTDMSGAAAVTGLLNTLAQRKAKVNVVGIIGLVENMPSGTAQRPGDVVMSMSGQTIEVDNTDAEGRLVLADIMWYVQSYYHAKVMIDLATLTGAITVALGDGHAGLFSNDETLKDRLISSGKATGELLWALPLSEHYDKQINSDIADVKNVGSNRGAGSITAAQFLQRFVDEKNVCHWAHLDIAGVAWSKFAHPMAGKGAVGFGVALLNHFVREYYEK